MAKTVKGMLLHAVDLLTASIGWIEMDDGTKAKQHIRETIGVLMEAESRLEVLMMDLEGDLRGMQQELANPVQTMQQRVNTARGKLDKMQDAVDMIETAKKTAAKAAEKPVAPDDGKEET